MMAGLPWAALPLALVLLASVAHAFTMLDLTVFPDGSGEVRYVAGGHGESKALPQLAGARDVERLDSEWSLVHASFDSLERLRIEGLEFSFRSEEDASLIQVAFPVATVARWRTRKLFGPPTPRLLERLGFLAEPLVENIAILGIDVPGEVAREALLEPQPPPPWVAREVLSAGATLRVTRGETHAAAGVGLDNR